MVSTQENDRSGSTGAEDAGKADSLRAGCTRQVLTREVQNG